MSNVHGPEPTLYLTLYPQDPAGIASQFNIELVVVIADVFGFCGTVHGVNVVNTSEEDHEDAELLSLVQADLTCHSSVSYTHLPSPRD